jgi:hypothetical protein
LIVAIAGICLLLSLPEILYKVYSGYRDTDARSLLIYLKDRYSFIFPEEMYNIKAGKALSGFDGRSSSFILKFSLPVKSMDTFISKLGDIEDDINYTERLDQRLTASKYPIWFKSPISEGKIIFVRRGIPDDPNVSFKFQFYIDTSSKKELTVYMTGIYRM